MVTGTAIAAAEAITGVALLFDPTPVVNCPLSTMLAGAAVRATGFAGIDLLGLSVACWPIIDVWMVVGDCFGRIFAKSPLVLRGERTG